MVGLAKSQSARGAGHSLGFWFSLPLTFLLTSSLHLLHFIILRIIIVLLIISVPLIRVIFCHPPTTHSCIVVVAPVRLGCVGVRVTLVVASEMQPRG
jgi:hypothetical protein